MCEKTIFFWLFVSVEWRAGLSKASWHSVLPTKSHSKSSCHRSVILSRLCLPNIMLFYHHSVIVSSRVIHVTIHNDRKLFSFLFPFVLTKVFSSLRSHCRNWVGTEPSSHRWPTKPTTVLEPAPFPCQKSVIVGIIIIGIIIVIVNIVKVVNGSSIVYHCNYFPPSSCFHWSFCQWTGHIFSNIASYT